VKNKSEITEYHLSQNQPAKPQFEIFELGQYLRRHGANASKPHIHSFYQIIWFKTGHGEHYVDFKAYDVQDNSIFFIAKNQVHYFDSGTEYAGVLMHFNESFIVDNDSKIEYLLKQDLFNNPFQIPTCCVNSNVNSILDEYLKLIRLELNNEKDWYQNELLRNYLKAFLIQVQRRRREFEKISGQSSPVKDDKRRQLLQFTDLLEKNYKDGMTVAEYADKMNISSRTLADLTKHLLGKSPSLMIHERTILEAKRMLIHMPLNVNEIGYRLGFEDASYFVKFFKKYTDMSPMEFRKTIS